MARATSNAALGTLKLSVYDGSDEIKLAAE